MMRGYGENMAWTWLFALVLLVGLVLLVVLAVRAFGGRAGRSGGSDRTGRAPGSSRARQILDERYAKGELTAEQYREQVQVLGEDRP